MFCLLNLKKGWLVPFLKCTVGQQKQADDLELLSVYVIKNVKFINYTVLISAHRMPKLPYAFIKMVLEQ